MPSLDRSTLRFVDDQAGYSILRGTKWPAGLSRLQICRAPEVYLEDVEIPPKPSAVTQTTFDLQSDKTEVPHTTQLGVHKATNMTA